MLQAIAGTISKIWRSFGGVGIETMDAIQIRVLVFQEFGFWCAQCIERDIAAQGHSVEEAMSELANTLAAYAEIALEEGAEPLADLPPAPARFLEMFERSKDIKPSSPIAVLERHEAPKIVPTLRVFQPQHA